MKQRLLAIISIMLVWVILDIVIDGFLLSMEYLATEHLWRPTEEMSLIFSNSITLITVSIFVLIYCRLISDKSLKKGLKLGVLVGLLTGVGFGVGSYGWMPISMTIAIGWMMTSLIKFSVAGAIAGYFIKTDI